MGMSEPSTHRRSPGPRSEPRHVKIHPAISDTVKALLDAECNAEKRSIGYVVNEILHAELQRRALKRWNAKKAKAKAKKGGTP